MNARLRGFVGLAIVCLVVLTFTRDARGFTYGEHHDILVAAVRRLSAENRAGLMAIYQGSENRARRCHSVDEGVANDRKNVACVSVADLGALAADHACSAAELERVVGHTDWTLRVVDRAMQTRRGMQAKRGIGTDFNALWRASDLDLDLIDAEYGSRAAANDAHFALPRASDSLSRYLSEALQIDSPPLNAVGLHAAFHAAALAYAVEASRSADPAARRTLLNRALLTESFAVHFLEDLFASGHIVGAVGDVATKKGTHDLYCELGLDVRTWRGASYGAHGDAHMQTEDIDHASLAVAKGLEQVLQAAAGSPEIAEAVGQMTPGAADRMFAFDVCKETVMPTSIVHDALWPMLEEVLGDSPVPARTATLLPRGRAEVGMFFGFGSGARAIVNTSTPSGDVDAGLTAAELELVGRLGVSLSDVVGPRSDGRVALEVGRAFGGDTSASNDPSQARYALRRAYKFGLHLPFLLLPGDLLFLGPVLAITSPKTLEAVAITSANGGLIPWQRPIVTRAGEFQLLLGRKVDVYLYDRHEPLAAQGSEPSAVSYRSIAFTSPLVEWRPFRSFMLGTGLGLSTRISTGFEMPFGGVNRSTGLATDALRTSFSVTLGMEFWARTFL